MKYQCLVLFGLISLIVCDAYNYIEKTPTCICDKCSTGPSPDVPWGTWKNKKGKGNPCDFGSHLENKGCEKGLICNERQEGPGICWDETPLELDDQGAEDCHSEPDVGKCHSKIKRYHFDMEDRTCKRFTYSGCNGNKNNYHSKSECLDKCGKHKEKTDCTSKPDPGLCKAIYHRFYFDKDDNRCKKFIYGGCGGNKNRYKTTDDCSETCGGKGKKRSKRGFVGDPWEKTIKINATDSGTFCPCKKCPKPDPAHWVRGPYLLRKSCEKDSDCKGKNQACLKHNDPKSCGTNRCKTKRDCYRIGTLMSGSTSVKKCYKKKYCKYSRGMIMMK